MMNLHDRSTERKGHCFTNSKTSHNPIHVVSNSATTHVNFYPKLPKKTQHPKKHKRTLKCNPTPQRAENSPMPHTSHPQTARPNRPPNYHNRPNCSLSPNTNNRRAHQTGPWTPKKKDKKKPQLPINHDPQNASLPSPQPQPTGKQSTPTNQKQQQITNNKQQTTTIDLTQQQIKNQHTQNTEEAHNKEVTQRHR